jgi:hypothetical protein
MEKEILEIAAIPDIQESWGAQNVEEMIGILKTQVYAVKLI